MMNLSQKPVKAPPPVATFIFPRNLADDVDRETGKHCITVSINNKKTLIPVEEPVYISRDIYDLFTSIGRYLPPNREYDPFAKR